MTTSTARAGSTSRTFEVRDRAWFVDFVLTALLAAATVTPYVSSGETESAVAALAMTVPLMFRRTLPTLTVAATIAGALLFSYLNSTGGLVIVAVPITVYSAARWMSHRLALVTLAAAAVGSVIGPARWLGFSLELSRFPAYAAVVVACVGIVTGAYLIGRRRSDSVLVARQQAAAETERLRLVQAEEDQRSRSASISERQRIARELHDIVAHSLSVIVVQAEGGRALATKHPERAPEVLGTIADAGREALVEMRRMVGLLRNENDDTASRAPAPGLFDLPELVRRSGVQASLETHGATPAVHPALGLTGYRIVQESLTNVLKHAGPAARTLVRVDYGPASMRILVADDGRGVSADAVPGGHGLQGMRERVALHGGTLTAGPRPGPPGGFSVVAELPLGRASSAPPYPPASTQHSPPTSAPPYRPTSAPPYPPRSPPTPVRPRAGLGPYPRPDPHRRSSS